VHQVGFTYKNIRTTWQQTSRKPKSDICRSHSDR